MPERLDVLDVAILQAQQASGMDADEWLAGEPTAEVHRAVNAIQRHLHAAHGTLSRGRHHVRPARRT